MKLRNHDLRAALWGGLLLLGAAGWAGVAPAAEADTILFLVGPEKHPPGTHEVAAGARLMAYCVEQAPGAKGLKTRVATEWVRDPEWLRQVRVVVFTGDQFPPTQMAGTREIMADLEGMAQRGCGMVCIHYATSAHQEFAPEEVQAALYAWVGGFGLFKGREDPTSSVARIFEATFTPVGGGHAILRGVEPFTLNDEPYFKLKFAEETGRFGVQPLVTALLPPEAPQKETVAWCIEGRDGHRGFSVVLPHFYVNWENASMRKLVLNGIFWTARQEVPAGGVDTVLPPLATFGPQAVIFTKPAPKPAAKPAASPGKPAQP